jgi:hypothetical protein
VLSDKAWADICAAGGRTPDDDARAALSKALFEDYPGFTYDRKRTIATVKRTERMLKNLAAYEADYREQFPPPPHGWWETDRHYESKRNIAIKTERDLSSLEVLRRRTEAELRVARTLQDANSRKQNEQRAMLYHWLCGIWLDHFGGELTYDRSGGDPGGPLVEFILTAMRQVMPKAALPSRESVRDNIDRYRREREKIDRERENFFRALRVRDRGTGD